MIIKVIRNTQRIISKIPSNFNRGEIFSAPRLSSVFCCSVLSTAIGVTVIVIVLVEAGNISVIGGKGINVVVGVSEGVEDGVKVFAGVLDVAVDEGVNVIAGVLDVAVDEGVNVFDGVPDVAVDEGVKVLTVGELNAWSSISALTGISYATKEIVAPRMHNNIRLYLIE